MLGSTLACARREEAPTRALLELERLCFVARAECKLGDDTDLSLQRSLVFDRFEVTRADLAFWLGDTARARRAEFKSDAALDTPERADWPAFLSFYEAEELARRRGMRLPKPREWLHVAVGRRDYVQPWGGPRHYFANTWVTDAQGHDFSLHQPARVGTYQNGVSRPFGCYDLLGNVWEWVDGIVPGYDPLDTLPEDLDDEGGTRSSILGGGYNSASRPTYQRDKGMRFHARTLHKNVLAPWIGVRLCAEAELYLWEQSGQWGHGAAAEQRVRAVARRWADEDALARAELRVLLADLTARPQAPAGIAWLAAGLAEAP